MAGSSRWCVRLGAMNDRSRRACRSPRGSKHCASKSFEDWRTYQCIAGSLTLHRRCIVLARCWAIAGHYHSTQLPSHVGPCLVVIHFPRQMFLVLPPLGMTSRFPAIALGSTSSIPDDASLATAVKFTAGDLSV